MLTFKTQLPVSSDKCSDDLLECARIWITGSPHSNMKEKMSSSLTDGSLVATGTESISCSVYKDTKQEITGIRYEKKEDNEIRWTTDIVGFSDLIQEKFSIAIQLSVDSELPVEHLDKGKPPYILKNIIQYLGGGKDGCLTVSDAPYILNDLDIEFAENLLRAKSDATMPIVYVSAGNDNRLFVDVARVAKSLAGMAHVVVEPSRSFSFKLMRKVSGENAYGGAVGIYWPDGIGKSLFLPSRFTDGKEMQNAIIDKVRNSLLSQRTIRECTWFYLQELLARKKITELKESDSKNIEEYIYHFDTEIASKNEEIRRLEEEILKMRHVIQLKSDRIDRQDNDIVVRSTEQDFYQAERLDILIDVLQSAISGVEQNSRRWAILKDIVDGHQGSGERNSILDKLKRILSTYDSMTTVIRAELISLGFEISEDGKHYKLIYRGDPRYSFVLSKSGSDRRGGRNAFSDLKRRLF